MACGLHCPRLMDIDMGAYCSHCSLMGPECGCDHGHIRLGSPYQEMNRRILSFAKNPDHIRRFLTITVLPISRRLLQVRLCQLL